MLNRICTQIVCNMVIFLANTSFKLNKCQVNKLNMAAFTASFSPRNIIESCIEILASMLNKPAKFKLIKLWQHM